MHVVICGGGVIGTAAAYALARRGVEVTVVERWRVGGAASGKSGGFLARDWCRGTPVDALARRSFDLHAEWAEALGNTYGYRRVDTIGTAMSFERRLARQGDACLAPWLARDAAHRSRIGTPETTAQLDPEAFTLASMAGAVRHGARLQTAAVSGLVRDGGPDGRRVTGIGLEGGGRIAADAVVLALGPWSLMAARWLPMPAIHGLKGHSVVFRPATALPAEAIFAEVDDGSGDILTPEIVPRADGTLYVCGLSGRGALPVDPSRVGPEPGGCARLAEVTRRLVPALAGAPVIREQACFRPITEDGLPLIGAVPGHDGVYVATGHSVWGMLNAPGTGEALAELIAEGRAQHVDLAPFALDRLQPLDADAVQVGSG